MNLLALGFLLAANVTLSSGEEVTIESNRKTTVTCEGSSRMGSKSSSIDDKCHAFHSESTCQGLAVGAVCAKAFNAGKGQCTSSGIFAGAPNCKCQ